MNSKELRKILEAGILEIHKPTIDMHIEYHQPETFRVLTDEELDWIDEKFPEHWELIDALKEQPFENREYIYISYIGEVLNIDTHKENFKENPFDDNQLQFEHLGYLIDYLKHDYEEAFNCSRNLFGEIVIYSVLKKLNKGRGRFKS